MSTTIRLPHPASSPGGHELFRDINRRVRALAGDGEAEACFFFCECIDASCAAVLRMSGVEFDALARDPDWYAVLPGHEDPESDVVVGRNDRYVLVCSTPDDADRPAA